MFEILETKASLQQDNDVAANDVRQCLKSHQVYLVNLMGSPGAGKTSALQRIIESLKDRYRIGVMEADVDSDVDAKAIASLGVKVIQLHTGGSCHMDARMTEKGLHALGIEDVDVVFLENVGNLVCPAEFDVGANLKMMILSTPEGDDKPLKYPLMFQVSDCMLINKIDVKEVFGFDTAKAKEYALALNPHLEIFAVSAKSGEGFAAVIGYLRQKIEEQS